jgi:hypothetical protein
MYDDSDNLETLPSDSSSVCTDTSNDSTDPHDIPLNFFDRMYFSKKDIKNVVQSYHRLTQKSFKLVHSDKRRYYVKCTMDQCSFKLNFNFRENNFTAPSTRMAHSCNINVSHEHTVSSLANDNDVQSWFDIAGRDSSVKGLRAILSRKGIVASKHTMKRCLEVLKKSHFVEVNEQFRYLDSYKDLMNSKGHFTSLEKNGEFFLRLCVVYREGIEGFNHYVERGMQLDGTFLKNSSGGTLLVACYKDGNNNIKIIAIAIVSTENEDNWSWFLEFLLSNLYRPPTFIISDRDRGLQNSVASHNIFHAYCFRHVLENFYLRFKNKSLKAKAWGLGKATNSNEFNRIKEWMNSFNPQAYEWLENVGLERITLLYSPVCRYGTLTSNNVESVNSRLRECRKLPIMELLILIEKIVALDRLKASQNALEWTGHYTKYARGILKNHIKCSGELLSFQLSETTYSVTSPAPLQTTYQVDIDNATCSCGGPRAFGFPCIHLTKVFSQLGIDESLFVCDGWKLNVYKDSTRRLGQMGSVTTIEQLVKGNTLPPGINRRRGRPRHRRIESQSIDRVPRRRVRLNRCGHCRESGHDRRNCPTLNRE